MFAHAQRAIGIGAKMTAIFGLLAALAIAAWQSMAASTAANATFVAVALTHAPAGLLGGALLGAILFGVIGFCVALLGVKRVGWTFTYTIFGAVLFASAVYLVRPLIDSAAESIGGISAAAALAALIGAASGYVVAAGLKDGPG